MELGGLYTIIGTTRSTKISERAQRSPRDLGASLVTFAVKTDKPENKKPHPPKADRVLRVDCSFGITPLIR